MIVRRVSRLASTDGFTLVEVLVALIVFLIGALGVAGLLVNVMYANRGATNRTRADELLYEKVEELQSTPYVGISDGTDQKTVGGVVFTREWTVTDDQPIDDVRTIELLTRWSDRGEIFEIRTATMRGSN